jgi:hypothetical protein
VRYEVAPNRQLTDKKAAWDWDSGWKILMEKMKVPYGWLS